MDKYANEEIPKDVPVRLPGPSYAVIARLVLIDGRQMWSPARGVRWSSTHVMVRIQESEIVEPSYLWLRSQDVQRTLHRPASR